jgi:hypothetical protein
MSVKYSKRPENISTYSTLRPSKIYPTWEFWFEKKPSGNPAHNDMNNLRPRLIWQQKKGLLPDKQLTKGLFNALIVASKNKKGIEKERNRKKGNGSD